MTRLTNEERRANEAMFEKVLKDYMLDDGSKYTYGGVLNALSSVTKMLESFAENADDLGMNREALEFAVEKLNVAYGECDIQYARNL